MRIFRFFGRGKKLPSLLRTPCSSSSVHPSSNGRDRHCPSINRDKVMEILGAVSQEDRLEIDDLLNKTRGHEEDSSSVTDDDESTEDDSIEEDRSQTDRKDAPDLSKLRYCLEMALENTLQGPLVSSPRFKLSPPVEYVTPRPCPVDMPAKAQGHRQPKPLNLQCVAGTTHGLADTSRQTTSPHLSQNPSSKGKNSARYEEVFPLPSPSPEKHYLPSPRNLIFKEVLSVAHPLPHPPRSPSNQHVPGRIHRSIENSDMPCRTPQNSPPGTPSHRLHPLSSVKTPRRSSSSPSSTRQSPAPITNSPARSPTPRQSPAPITNSPPRSPTPRQSPAPITNSPPRSPTPKALCPRKWTKGVILGQGTFGTVHEGLNLEDGSFFAVKVSSREDVSPEIQQEVDVLSKLEHPNIVRYFGSSVQEGRLCIFLELVRMGSLDSILRKYKRFEDHTIRGYTRQILLGLEYLHAKKTIHRDIKCANILVDVNGQVKLSDFGVAKQMGESLASSLKGTPLYMAPEVLTPNKNCYSFPADIWSLGCTVLEMVDGKPPWSDLAGFAFLFKVKKGELPPMPEHLSPEGKDFICRCLKFHPEDRPTAIELLQHPFVVNVSTPEPFIPWSPPSPVSPVPGAPSSPPSSNTWAFENWYLSSPSHASCFDNVLHRAQTLVHGR